MTPISSVEKRVIWEDNCEVKKTLEQMKSLEQKFKSLGKMSRSHFQVNTVAKKKTTKHQESSSESSNTDAEDILQSYLFESREAHTLESINRNYGLHSPEVLASTIQKSSSNRVLDSDTPQHVTRNPSIILDLKLVIAAPMIAARVKSHEVAWWQCILAISTW